MYPINALDKLIKKRRSLAGSTVAVSLVVHIMRPEIGDLLCEVFPQRHPPNSVSCDDTGLPHLRPQRLRVAEDTARSRTESGTDPRSERCYI